MSAEALYEVMGLKGYDVEGTWRLEEGVLYVQVAVPREALACRACGCSKVQRQGGQRREWKGAPIGVTPVVITMDSPRVKCLECGAKTWHQPSFAEGQRRVTKTFEQTVQAWLSRVTIQDAALVFTRYGILCVRSTSQWLEMVFARRHSLLLATKRKRLENK